MAPKEKKPRIVQELSIQAVSPPAFAPKDDEKWMAYLREHGYAVISVFPEDETKERELARLHDLFWNDMTTVHPRARELHNQVWPSYFGVGILKDPSTGFGQSEFVWECRNIATIQHAFAKVHSCEQVSDLACSFDTACAFRNPARNKAKFKTKNGWLHVDQGSAVTEWCVQGLLNLIDANEETGGFVCLPGSHADGSYEQLLQFVQPSPNNNFIEVPEGHTLWNKTSSLLKLPAGSLLLWDSRLIHSNTRYQVEPKNKQPLLTRLVSYICMVPRTRMTDQARTIRERCIEEGLTTNHWPDRPKIERLPYPRHHSFEPLNSCALPPAVIRERYGNLI